MDRTFYSARVALRAPREVYDEVQELWPVTECSEESTDEERSNVPVIAERIMVSLGLKHVVPGTVLLSLRGGNIGYVELIATTFTEVEAVAIHDAVVTTVIPRGWVVEESSVHVVFGGDI